jgi:hypothetical protein
MGAVLLTAVLFISGPLGAREESVVNAAPAFAGGGTAGRKITLASLRGKPVILVFAPSPSDLKFRKQMSEFKGSYERLAAQGMISFAAFTSAPGRIPSNIPFILVDDPSPVASAYGVGNGFAIAVIGPDGNLDCLSLKALPGQRILDLVNNNAARQTDMRR